MAKKKNDKFDLNGFDFDSDLDFPSFDFDTKPIKNDRKATTKIRTSVFAGAKDTAKSPEFIKRVIKKSLPNGYGQALDFADQTSGTLRSLYNTAAKEIKPQLNELKRITKRVMPSSEKYLPKDVAARIKKWSETESTSSSSYNEQQMRDASITAQLGDIFKYHAEDSARRSSEGEIKDRLKEGIDQSRHRDTLGQLDSIRGGIYRLNNYNDKINIQYQRRSLELQFRHYFVAQDSLEEQKRHNAMAMANLEGILKNTGLPDYVKLKNTERLSETVRNKFFESFGDGLFDKRNNLIRNLGSRISDKVKEKASNFASDVGSGLSAGESMLDMQEMMRSMGGAAPTAGGIAGNMVGGSITDSVGKKVGKKLRSFANKSPELIRYGNETANFLNNLPEKLAALAQGQKFENGGITDPFVQGFKDLVNASLRVDTTVTSDKIGGMQADSLFNRQTNKSITEIIPGLLTRIHREIKVLRTGNESEELLHYDFSTNKFVDRSVAKGNLVKKLFSKQERDHTNDDVNRLIDKIDPNGTLSAEQRKELGRQFLRDRTSPLEASPERLTDRAMYKEGAQPHSKAYADLFKQYFSNDTLSEKKLNFPIEYKRIGQSVGDKRKEIQDNVTVGNREFLEELGLLEPGKDNINMDKLYSYFYGDAEENTTNRPAPRRSSRQRGSLRTPQSNPRPRADFRIGGRTEETERTGTSAPSTPSTLATPELLQAMKEANIREIAQTMSETLLRIEKQLESGVGFGGSSGESTPQSSGRWWNSSLKDFGKGTLKLGMKGLRLGRKIAGGIVSAPFNALKKTWEIGGKIGSWGLGQFGRAQDVYVGSEITPRLRAVKLKAGQYFDKATGAVIKKFSDITGPVIDDEGNEVLSAEEIRQAYVKTKGGSKLLSALGAVFRGAKNVSNSIVNSMIGSVGLFYRLGFGLVKSAYGLLNRPQDVYTKNGGDPVLLARIMKAGGYRSRINGHVIKKIGDIDGPVLDDENNVVLSVADLAGGLFDASGKPLKSGLAKLGSMATRLIGGTFRTVGKGIKAVKDTILGGVNKVKEFVTSRKDKTTEGKVKGDLAIQRLTEILGVLKDRLPERKKRVLGDLDGDGIREGSYQDRQTKQKKKEGTNAEGLPNPEQQSLGKGKSFMAALGAGASNLMDKMKGSKEESKNSISASDAAMWGAGGAGIWGASKKIASGGIRGAASFVGQKVLPFIARTAIPALARGAFGLGAAAVGLLGWPVTLSLAAAGGAYYLYKRSKRKTLDTLSKVRYAQYGFLPSETDHLQEIFGLEDTLMPGVVYAKGIASLDDKKIDMQKVMSAFNISPANTAGRNRFLNWLMKRFQPVFLTHMTALKTVKENAELNDVDSSLSTDEKKKYLNLAKFPEGPYGYSGSPFGDEVLSAGPQEVNIQLELAQNDLDKQSKGKTNSDLKPLTEQTIKSGIGAVALTKPGSTKSGTDDFIQPIRSQTIATGITPKFNTVEIIGSELAVSKFTSGKVAALDCIRYKAYGLVELAMDKSKALDALETLVAKDIAFSKGIGRWQGSIEKTLLAIGPSFGIEGVHNNRAYDWITWFKNRFLPIYLNYVGALYNTTKKEDAKQAVTSLKSQQAVEVALAIYTTNTTYDGNTASVWTLRTSPWPGYSLNTDVKSIDANLQGLMDLAKTNVLDETVSNQTGGSTTGLGAKPEVSETKKSSGFWAKVKDTLFLDDKNDSSSGSDTGGKSNGNWFNEMFSGPKSNTPTGNAVTGPAGASVITGGAAVSNPSGGGSGGAVDSLPMPNGNKTWASMKDLILGAAKMVGVDGKLMATMAAIESGFNATVKAGSSSATGLYQFISSTWKSMVSKYGAKYGIAPGTPATDPRANALMGAEYIKENANALQGVVNRPLTDTDLYLAHFMGAGGAKQFLRAPPDAIAANIFPSQARANPSIFSKNNNPLTISQVYGVLNGLVRNKGKQYGLDSGSASIPDTTGAGTPVAGKGKSFSDIASGADNAPPKAFSDIASGADNAPPMKTNNPIGNFPISDSSPGMDFPISSTPATPVSKSPSTTDSGASPITPVVSSSPANTNGGGGFQTPKARDIAAQQQYQKELNADVLGSIDTTGQKMLAVNQTQLETLQAMLKVMIMKGSNDNQNAPPTIKQTSENAAPTSTPGMRAFNPARPMGSPPISMAKGI